MLGNNACRPYILPEVYSSAFTEAAEDEQIRPKAILFIKMVGAKHVPKMDIISQSDPYVRYLASQLLLSNDEFCEFVNACILFVQRSGGDNSKAVLPEKASADSLCGILHSSEHRRRTTMQTQPGMKASSFWYMTLKDRWAVC